MARTRKSKAMQEMPWSWHRTAGWQGQLKRTERWLERVKSAKSFVDCEDYLYAFFQSCYHLKDWLQDSNVPREDINQFISKNVEMRLCRDICNLTKHLRLTDPSQPLELSIAIEYVLSDGWLGKNTILVALSDGKKYDLLKLADRCLKLWELFIRETALSAK